MNAQIQPFAVARSHVADHDFRIFATNVDTGDLRPLITRLLPDQGAIEVQRDVAGKEHVWHTHETDETLVILDGAVRFYWDQGEMLCGPGTVISLPAGMAHGSVALDGGATYLIAFPTKWTFRSMAELERRLNVWRGTGMMVSIVLGAGLLTLPGLAVQAAGEAALVIWLLCAVTAIPLLAVFAMLSRQWPDAGGIAVILSKGFGDFGYCAGTFLFLGAVVVGLPAIALTGGHYLAAAAGGDPHAYAIMLIAGAVAVNVRSARVATWINSALAAVVVVAILVLLVVGWTVTSPGVPDLSGRLAALPDVAILMPTFMMLFFAFTGWEVAASLGGEFKSPERDIPVAVVLSFVLVTGTYIGLALVADASGVTGNAEAIFSDIVGAAFGAQARWVVSAVAVCLIFANLSAAVWAVSRMVFAAARENILPARLVETRDGIPQFAVIATGMALASVAVASWAQVVTLPGLLAMAGQNFLVLYGAAAAVMLRVAVHPMARLTAALSLSIVCVLLALHGAMAIAYPVILLGGAWLATRHRREAGQGRTAMKLET